METIDFESSTLRFRNRVINVLLLAPIDSAMIVQQDGGDNVRRRDRRWHSRKVVEMIMQHCGAVWVIRDPDKAGYSHGK